MNINYVRAPLTICNADAKHATALASHYNYYHIPVRSRLKQFLPHVIADYDVWLRHV